MRLLSPNDEPLPEPTSEGMEGLPQACWKIDDCLAHRCMVHSEVPQINETCEHDNFAECGACILARAERAETQRDALREALTEVDRLRSTPHFIDPVIAADIARAALDTPTGGDEE